jgi:hypothetical protein
MSSGGAYWWRRGTGQVVLRSRMLVDARSAVEYVQACDALDESEQSTGMISQFVEWAASSPRQVHLYQHLNCTGARRSQGSCDGLRC